jgi:tRNA(Glu) U13 pseudouridine synthase TruD
LPYRHGLFFSYYIYTYERLYFAVMRKRPIRPNLGGILRTPDKEPRRRFLYVEVTKEEKNKIRDHCVRKKISISQYLAELMLADAAKPKPAQNVRLKMEFELAPEEYEKLELLAFQREKKSIHELMRELIQENLDIQKMHSNRNRLFLRFYLSEEEHAIVFSHIAAKNIPAGKYATMVVLKALNLDGPQSKEKKEEKRTRKRTADHAAWSGSSSPSG